MALKSSLPQLPHPWRWPHTLRGPGSFQALSSGDPAWTQPFPSLGWGRGPQARGHHLWLLPVLWRQQGLLLLLRHIPRSPREREGCTLPGPCSCQGCWIYLIHQIEREKKRGNVQDRKGKFLSFLTQTGTNQVAESWSFTPPPTCTDTIIKLFSKPMHLDNMTYCYFFLKKKNKKEIFHCIGW